MAAGALWFPQVPDGPQPKADRVEVAGAYVPHPRIVGDVSQRAVHPHRARPVRHLPVNGQSLKQLYRDQGLQLARFEGLEEHVYQTFQRMYDVFERDRHLIDAARFCEVRYEDLIKQPVEEVRKLYDHLGLGDFAEVQPAVEAYFARKGRLQDQSLQAAPRAAGGNWPPLALVHRAVRLCVRAEPACRRCAGQSRGDAVPLCDYSVDGVKLACGRKSWTIMEKPRILRLCQSAIRGKMRHP